MRRLLLLLLLAMLTTVRPAAADPGVRIVYEADLLRVTLEGSYTGAQYQVYRAPSGTGPFSALTSQATLCTGDCYLTDDTVAPGDLYYYRFDLQTASGAAVSFGPYEVAVPRAPLAVSVSPNPMAAAGRVVLSVPGSGRRDAAVPGEARVIDLQGRTVRQLFAGTLARGTTSLSWDGRGDDGRVLGAGLYFVRLDTPLGSATTRVVRFR